MAGQGPFFTREREGWVGGATEWERKEKIFLGGAGLNRKKGIILLNMRVTMQSVVIIIVVSTDPAATVLR